MKPMVEVFMRVGSMRGVMAVVILQYWVLCHQIMMVYNTCKIRGYRTFLNCVCVCVCFFSFWFIFLVITIIKYVRILLLHLLLYKPCELIYDKIYCSLFHKAINCILNKAEKGSVTSQSTNESSGSG